MSLKVTEDRSDPEDLHLYATPREQRFRRFASLEFEGQLYMTPYDFIQAVTNDEPKRKQEFYIDKIARQNTSGVCYFSICFWLLLLFLIVVKRYCMHLLEFYF